MASRPATRSVIISRRRIAETAAKLCAAPVSLIETVVDPDKESQALMLQAAERFSLSARAYHRVLKVALTLADLAGADRVGRSHLAEALSYRLNFQLT